MSPTTSITCWPPRLPAARPCTAPRQSSIRSGQASKFGAWIRGVNVEYSEPFCYFECCLDHVGLQARRVLDTTDPSLSHQTHPIHPNAFQAFDSTFFKHPLRPPNAFGRSPERSNAMGSFASNAMGCLPERYGAFVGTLWRSPKH